jgi:Flp pilus assembly protein TadG
MQRSVICIWKYRHFTLMSGEGAQALLELALTVPVLALLLLGASELACVSSASIEVENAAKAAVQYGSQNSTTAADTTGMQTAASNEASNVALGPTSVSTSYICSDGTSPSGTPLACSSSTAEIETILTVNTQATINPLIHVSVLPITFTVHGQAVQKCLQC